MKPTTQLVISQETDKNDKTSDNKNRGKSGNRLQQEPTQQPSGKAITIIEVN